MPRNMAMHQPRSRIIRLERQSEIASARKHSDVATGRVIKVERLGADSGIIGRAALRENDKVGTVKVDGVS